MNQPPKPPLSKYKAPSADIFTVERTRELESLVSVVENTLRKTVHIALRIGLRILSMEREDGTNTRAAIAKVAGMGIPESTCYRWTSAALAALGAAQGETDAAAIRVPAWDPQSKDWQAAESLMESTSQATTIRRLLLGPVSQNSDETRLEELVDRTEKGDPHAGRMLAKVESGELTLVQAIRAASGAAATKGKTRNDPVYLDIDGQTGQPTGLFPRCVITLSRTFAIWEDLDETARQAARSSWKALVANLPRELR